MVKRDSNEERDYKKASIFREIMEDCPSNAGDVKLRQVDERFLEALEGVLPKG